MNKEDLVIYNSLLERMGGGRRGEEGGGVMEVAKGGSGSTHPLIERVCAVKWGVKTFDCLAFY